MKHRKKEVTVKDGVRYERYEGDDFWVVSQ
jgi:hypothetical protein